MLTFRSAIRGALCYLAAAALSFVTAWICGGATPQSVLAIILFAGMGGFYLSLCVQDWRK
jgi:hypothetical protein